MKHRLVIVVLLFILIASCTHSISLSDQLRENFTAHLKLIDSALALDSFRYMDMHPMNQQLGRIIDDSIYVRALNRVKEQLGNAQKAGKTDSVAFYQEEVDYMVPNIDSLSKSIAKGDTTRKFGTLVRCFAQIRRNNLTQKMVVVYFFDENMNITNSDMIDDMIKAVYVKMK